MEERKSLLCRHGLGARSCCLQTPFYANARNKSTELTCTLRFCGAAMIKTNAINFQSLIIAIKWQLESQLSSQDIKCKIKNEMIIMIWPRRCAQLPLFARIISDSAASAAVMCTQLSFFRRIRVPTLCSNQHNFRYDRKAFDKL